jgi:hypothetical protein
MSDELSETASGATKGLLGALGFTLILLGCEALVDKAGERLTLGVGLLAAGALVFFAGVFWKQLQQGVTTGISQKVNRISADPMWWVAIFSVFTTFSLNQLGFVPTMAMLVLLGIGYAIYSWRKAEKSQDSSRATATVSNTALHNPQVDRDLLLLLYFSVYQTTAVMLAELIRRAPDVPDGTKLDTDFGVTFEAAQGFVRHVAIQLGSGTDRHMRFRALMSETQYATENLLESTPLDQRPAGVDQLVLQRHMVAHSQCSIAIRFLMSEKHRVEEILIGARPGLIERKNLRSPP